MLLDRLLAKRTNFTAGGLLTEGCDPLAAPRFLSASFPVLPRRRDERDLCLLSDNQGQTSMCAAYATCGFCEVWDWIRTGTPQQKDPLPLWKRCKELDKLPEAAGTTLDVVCRAAIELKYAPGAKEFRLLYTPAEYKAAVVQYRVCLCGFRIWSNWNRVGRNGRIPDRGASDSFLGGHLVLGNYYDATNGPGIQNSWGSSWALHGHADMSWAEFERSFFMGAVLVE